VPGYDAILQAMTGLMSVNGDATTGPMRYGTPVVDMTTGLYAVVGILMAAYERERSGRGQFLDMTLYDCGMAVLHPQAANFFLNGKRPMPIGNPHPNLAPCDKFKTKTGEIFIAIGNDGQFRKLTEEIGRPEMADDPRYRTNGDRVTHRLMLCAELAAIFADTDGKAVAHRLLKAGLPAGPVMAVDEAMAAEHTAARDMVAEKGNYRGVGTPIKLSRTPGGLRRNPPRFAEHSEDVLKERGYDDEDIAALRKAGVLPGKRRR
jgi:formyl-CoA transferase